MSDSSPLTDRGQTTTEDPALCRDSTVMCDDDGVRVNNEDQWNDDCPVGDPGCDAPDDGEWHCHDACEPPSPGGLFR